MRNLFVALVLVVAACSSATDTDQPGTGAADDAGASTTTLVASGTSDTTPGSATTSQTDDVSGVILLTDSGGGPRPLFSWEPVPDAMRYAVTVRSDTGETYWAGFTTATQLQMGDPSLPDDVMGPKIADGYSWVVFALDEGGRLVASSEIRAISP